MFLFHWVDLIFSRINTIKMLVSKLSTSAKINCLFSSAVRRKNLSPTKNFLPNGLKIPSQNYFIKLGQGQKSKENFIFTWKCSFLKLKRVLFFDDYIDSIACLIVQIWLLQQYQNITYKTGASLSTSSQLYHSSILLLMKTRVLLL